MLCVCAYIENINNTRKDWECAVNVHLIAFMSEHKKYKENSLHCWLSISILVRLHSRDFLEANSISSSAEIAENGRPNLSPVLSSASSSWIFTSFFYDLRRRQVTQWSWHMSIDGRMVKLMMGYLMHSATAKLKPLDCFWAFSSRQEGFLIQFLLTFVGERAR